MTNSTPSIQLSNIAKHYGYVKALDDIDFVAYPGQVVSLLGDNGAGKSTLMKVISGAHGASSGTIDINGERVKGKYNPTIASSMGVEMVYQDLALVDMLDIATNMQLGQEPLKPFPLNLFGFVDFR